MKHVKRKRHIICLVILSLLFSLTFPTSVQAAKVSLNKTKVSLCVGSTYQLKARNAKKVKWSSTNKKIVPVTSRGKITGRQSGTATIKATVGSRAYKCKVTVKKVALSKTTVSIAYIHTYHTLPSNFITKAKAKTLGWTGGSLLPYKKYGSIGGDLYSNYEKTLPTATGRVYYECDIDTLGARSRGGKRIIYSNDGLIYYTSNHYASFTRLY